MRPGQHQGDADVSDEAQKSAACSRIPEGAIVGIYRDSGGHNSGFSTDRPDYQRMLADLRRGELAGITAYDSSRLNRNAENALALLRECHTRGDALFVSESMRPADPFEPDVELEQLRWTMSDVRAKEAACSQTVPPGQRGRPRSQPLHPGRSRRSPASFRASG